jgi:hypothetical protein
MGTQTPVAVYRRHDTKWTNGEGVIATP